MKLRTILTKWTAVPAAILLLGIVCTLLSWRSLAGAEFRLLVASETSEKADTQVEKRQSQLGIAQNAYDDDVQISLTCHVRFGRSSSICEPQGAQNIAESKTNLRAAEGRLQGAKSAQTDAQDLAEDAAAALETSRFYFVGVMSLTGVALLGFIATAIVIIFATFVIV
jgi:hypothetical protein